MNLPKQYEIKLRELLGDAYEQYLASFSERYGQTLRVNRFKAEPADFIRRFLLKEAVSWCDCGFYYEGEARLSAHPYYYAGVYYLQEPSAMAPAAFLPVEPGERVLDLCAAPGGKATALAAKLGGRGLLVANDISASRCKALLKNMEMAGVANSLITCEEPGRLSVRFPEYFDKILVDAPCSGEGMFRKEPAMAKNWSPEEVARYASLQAALLESAARMLRSGGMLLYSTCTFSPEEDERQVDHFLAAHPEFSLAPLPSFPGVEAGRHFPGMHTAPEEMVQCRRFWPHKLKGEGHFTALLQKREEADVSGSRFDARGEIAEMPATRGRIPETLAVFLAEINSEMFVDWERRLYFVGERAYLLPEGCPELSGLRLVRSGLYLGDVKKKRFEPSQALAMALREEAYPRTFSLPVEDARVERYLKGETLDMGADCPDGWVLFCVEEFPLGWGKCNRGRLKNKYNPAWRKQ